VGDDVILEPQDADKHAAALFEASHGSKEGLRIWDYLAVGPWADEKSFKAALRDQSTSLDPIFYTVCDKASGAPCGQISLMDIHPQTARSRSEIYGLAHPCNARGVPRKHCSSHWHMRWMTSAIGACSGGATRLM
jgi:RimJ/RimL family protein N-acetyltransferase